MQFQKFLSLCITVGFILFCLIITSCNMHANHLIAKNSKKVDPIQLSCAMSRGDESRLCAMNQINK